MHYAITGGTATAGGPDYTVPPADRDADLAEGGPTDQTITFTIKDDALSEGKETVLLTLTLPATPQNAVLGGQTTTALVIAHSDGTKVEATAKAPRVTFTNDDQEVVTVALGGKVGSMTVYRYDGAGDIAEIALADTDPAKSTVSIAVKKPRGLTTDGRVQLGEVTGTGARPGTGGAKALALGKADLVGTGLAGDGITLPAFLGSLVIGDIKNGADVTLGGAPPAKPANAGHAGSRPAGSRGRPPTRRTSRFTDPKGRLAGLTAISVGEGSITAASAGAITAKGKPKSKALPAGLPGDFNSDLVLSGVGVDPRQGQGPWLAQGGRVDDGQHDRRGHRRARERGLDQGRRGRYRGRDPGERERRAGDGRGVRGQRLLLGASGAPTPGLKLESFTATGLIDPARPAFADSSITADTDWNGETEVGGHRPAGRGVRRDGRGQPGRPHGGDAGLPVQRQEAEPSGAEPRPGRRPGVRRPHRVNPSPTGAPIAGQ